MLVYHINNWNHLDNDVEGADMDLGPQGMFRMSFVELKDIANNHKHFVFSILQGYMINVLVWIVTSYLL